MDPTLADLYNTLAPVEVSEEEIQKTAQLNMLNKIAEEAGINIEQLSDEQIVEAYNALNGVVKTAAAAPAPQAAPADLEKEASVMFQNADQMGRIMAHAYVDELKGIQKAAMLKAATDDSDEDDKGGDKDKGEGKNPLLAAIEKKKEMKEEKEEEDKEKSAFERAVEAEAYEILKQANAVREDGSILSPAEFLAEAQSQVDPEQVKVAALKTLESMGYPVQWKE